MASEVLAKELLLYEGSTSGNTQLIGRATSYTLNVSKGTIDTTNFETSGYSSYVVDLKSWTVDCEAIYVWDSVISGETKVSGKQILDNMLNSDTSCWLVLKPSTASKEYFYGQAFPTSWSLAGSSGDVLKVSMSFTGSGTLSIGTTV